VPLWAGAGGVFPTTPGRSAHRRMVTPFGLPTLTPTSSTWTPQIKEKAGCVPSNGNSAPNFDPAHISTCALALVFLTVVGGLFVERVSVSGSR